MSEVPISPDPDIIYEKIDEVVLDDGEQWTSETPTYAYEPDEQDKLDYYRTIPDEPSWGTRLSMESVFPDGLAREQLAIPDDYDPMNHTPVDLIQRNPNILSNFMAIEP